MFNHIQVLNKTLDAAWKRNEVLSNNLANAETPGFKRSDVEFESILKAYLDGSKLPGVTTHQKHIPIGAGKLSGVEPRVEVSNTYSTRLDGNNVDADVEMAEMAKNTLIFNSAQAQINSYFSRLRSVINEGK